MKAFTLIALGTKTYRMSREQAYCLCGAAMALKISEIVDAPDWIRVGLPAAGDFQAVAGRTAATAQGRAAAALRGGRFAALSSTARQEVGD